MDFPTIHTNFWDTVIAVPAVMIIVSAVFMGYFYGYGAIGSYASLKTSIPKLNQ